MRKRTLKSSIFLFLIAMSMIIFMNIFLLAAASENQLSIRKDTEDLAQHTDPSEIYDHITVKIRPYKTFRLAFLLHMDDGEDIWIYYYPTGIEPYQEYEHGPIHTGLNSQVKYKEWNILNWDISLDLESISLELELAYLYNSKMSYIKKIEILGNHYDLAFILVYHLFDDGSANNIIIDDFNAPGQDIWARGWDSEKKSKFQILFDSNMQGYLEGKDIDESDSSDTDDNQSDNQGQTYPYWYGSYYGGSYYGNWPYSSAYYGGAYSSGYYGGSYYSGGYYGGLYGSYYGMGYYGSSYYGGGFYNGLYGGGYYGGLYGGGYGGGYYGGGFFPSMGLYGGLYGGLSLRNYYGGPIGYYGGSVGLPFSGLLSPFI